MKVRISEIRDEATDIRSYCLEPVESPSLPAFRAGAHVDVFISDDLSRQYSICSDPKHSAFYRIGVQKDPNSTGGSEAIFTQFKVGDVIDISEPRNHFELEPSGTDFVLIGGGIGITPILAMAQALAHQKKNFQLFYLARSANRFAFADLLDQTPLRKKVVRHCDETDGMPDLASMIGAHANGRHVYCCGPGPLMDAVKDAGRSWPPMTVHFEHFTRAEIDQNSNTSFDLQLGRDGPVVTVGADDSVLDILRANGYEVETQCTQGLCGTCEQRVLEGEVDHRDLVLEDDEKAENSCMMVCVSRALSKKLVLDV